jgi:AhpD family alkylhydroperoxidase
MGEGGKPRISPGDRRQLGWLNFGISKLAGLATRGKPPNIFTTLGRHRGLFRRWLWFAVALMPGGKLPREETELVILRVAHNTGSEYEWSQHERIGKRAGLSEEEISRVRAGGKAPGWPERRALLLRAADEMHEQRQIGSELWTELSRHLDEVLLIELCMLIGHYEMLAMTLNTLEVEPETPARL